MHASYCTPFDQFQGSVQVNMMLLEKLDYVNIYNTILILQ